MDPGTVINIISNAIKLGNDLVTVYQTLKDARSEVNERIIQIRNHWGRTEAQLEFLARTWTTLSDDHLATQEEILKVLLTKLKYAKGKLERLLKAPRARSDGASNVRPTVKRWKYLFVKSYLDDTIKSLDQWQQMFDPSWYLILRVASPLIDTELAQLEPSQQGKGSVVLKTARQIRGVLQGERREDLHLVLPSDGLAGADSSVIPFSAARHVRRAGASKWLIVDPVPCEAGSHVSSMANDVRTLATKLYYADPNEFGLLKCRGVLKVNRNSIGRLTAFDLVFETVSSEPPRTLRSCLASRTQHTLTERFDLAKQLAKSVNYLHTIDFVHKNICPENLVGFGMSGLGSFYLLGFEQVRSADGVTYLRGDANWHKDLYRHPSRQGMFPTDKYSMQHDIYSLGVCLLEIGLWETFVLYGPDGKVMAPNAAMLGVPIEDLRRMKPDGIKGLLIDLARCKLPAAVGDLYTQVVINCLTCLDETNADFGDEDDFDQEDEVAVGVRYIEKILMKLNSIAV